MLFLMYIDKAASLVSPTCLCPSFRRWQLFIYKSQNYQIPVCGCYATLLESSKTKWLQIILAYYFHFFLKKEQEKLWSLMMSIKI